MPSEIEYGVRGMDCQTKRQYAIHNDRVISFNL
jgi:hypothetical protein